MQHSEQAVGAIAVERTLELLEAAPSEPRLDRPRATSLAEFKVIRRNGAVVGFEPAKIVVAMTKAFIAVRGGQGAASAAIREQVEALASSAVATLVRRQPAGGTFHIEDIQDQVELSLMRAGAHDVARSYVLYRERRAQERAQQRDAQPTEAGELTVVDGERRFLLDRARLEALIQACCHGLDEGVSARAVLSETLRNLYDGVPLGEVHKSAILAARALIETDPDYGRVSARLLLHSVRHEVLGEEVGGRSPRRAPGPVRSGPVGPRAASRARPAIYLPGTADPVRPLLPASRGAPLRTAADLLHAGGHGPGAQRGRSGSPRDRVLRSAVEFRLHVLDPDPFQFGNLPPPALVLLPGHGFGQPGGDLRGDQGERAAGQVCGRSGQRLDAGAGARLAHSGHQRQVPGGRAFPEGGQRYGGRGQSGGQAQRSRVLLPGSLAPGYRGISRVAQEHRR